MKLLYRIAADMTVVIHFAYVAFLLFGLLLILAGMVRKWSWIRNFWFRMLHLGMIGIVVAESWYGVTCPLTTWEKDLRRLAGEETYQGDFIANWFHDMLFFDFSDQTFTIIYSVFGLAVAATFVLAPPRMPWRKQRHLSESGVDA